MEPENNKPAVNNNEFLRQYESQIKGELVVIEYAEQDRKIFLTKLVMSDQLKENGYLDLFLEAVLDMIREKNVRVMPTNPAIAGYMRKNRRKYQDLLPVGINI